MSNLCQIPELCQISRLSQILVCVKFGPCSGPPPCQIFGRAPPPHPVSNFGRAPGPDVKFWPSSGPRGQILAKPLGRPPGCVKFFESCQNSGTRWALSCQIFSSSYTSHTCGPWGPLCQISTAIGAPPWPVSNLTHRPGPCVKVSNQCQINDLGRAPQWSVKFAAKTVGPPLCQIFAHRLGPTEFLPAVSNFCCRVKF